MSDAAVDPAWHAVVDIGSNSVRLVIYDVAGQAMLPHYNERVMAGLGKGLPESGRLSAEGVETALKALGRFRAILDGLDVRQVRAVATAAVRAASDGAQFLARAQRETRFRIDVIPGTEEARLSALGVASGIHQADGLVGDLGGSSLEFARLADGQVAGGETHMLGPLAMLAADDSEEKMAKRVRRTLRASSLLPGHGGRFYMVGGAWRALAKFHMDLTGYPLQQLHAYRLDRRAVLLIHEASQSRDAILRQRLASASQKRAASLPYAAMVLKEVVEIGKFDDVVVSVNGLREGVVREGLKGLSAVRDPLLDGIDLFLRQQAPRRAFGMALHGWLGGVIDPGRDLFGGADASPRVIAAACLLADSAARFHPDHRADMAYDQALRGPFSGVTHAERAFIALAVGYRYARNFEPPPEMLPLVSQELARLAAQLGACMRLGAVYSGRSAAVLNTAALGVADHRLVLSVGPAHRAMVSQAVERRLEVAAGLLGLDPVIEALDER